VSWKLIGQSWETLSHMCAGCPGALTSAERLVLMCLAAYADEDGASIYPSQERIAAETGLSRRAAQLAVRVIEEIGWLRRDGRTRHGVIIYRLNLPASMGDQCAPAGPRGAQPVRTCAPARCAAIAPRERNQCALGAQPLRTSTSVNQSEILSLSTGGEQMPRSKDGRESALRPPPTQAEAVQGSLFGAGAEQIAGWLEALDEADRAEVLGVLRTAQGLRHGQGAISQWARAHALEPRTWLASRRAPVAYVRACLEREIRAVGERAVREEAERLRQEAAEQERARRAEVERTARRAEDQERAELEAAFEGLQPDEREAIVTEAEARLPKIIRLTPEARAKPLGAFGLGGEVRKVMRARADGRNDGG